MAGTVTIIEHNLGSVQKIAWSWTSTAGGAADLVSVEAYTGKVLACTTDPGAAAPTDNYTLTITDGGGEDILLGAGLANRDTSNTEHLLEANLGAVSNSLITMNITGAGNAKAGEVFLWIR